jgi:peptide/nickel transport system substrate-binding protein
MTLDLNLTRRPGTARPDPWTRSSGEMRRSRASTPLPSILHKEIAVNEFGDAKRRGGLVARTAGATAALALCWAAGALADDAPKPGGTLIVARQNQAQCIDPQQDNYGYGSFDGRELVDSLTDQSYSDPTRFAPWLAASWEINKDASSYVFHLRKDVTFSDGTKLDAQIVKDNFDTLAKIPGAAGASYLRDATVTVVDPATVRIDFKEPNVPFLAASSTPELGIVAPATLAKSAEQRCHDGVVGTGPFVIESITYNEQAVFDRRKGYNWASPLRGHQGEAYLDKIVYKVIPEANVRTGALTSHQVHLIEAVSEDDATALEKEGFALIKVPGLGTAVNLLINTSRGILADKQVRLALQHAINRKEVNDLAFSGYKIPATGVLTAHTPYYLDQSADLGFDPELAKRLLDGAGWKQGADGLRSKDGKPLLITVSFYSAPINKAFLEVVQQELRDVGIDFRLRPLTGGAYDAALLAGDYDLHRWEWSLADADVLRQVYSTKTLNRFRLPADNGIDAPLDAQRAVADPVARKQLTDAAQKTIIAEAYALPVFDSVYLWAADKKVRGIAFGAGGSGGPHQILYDAWLAN